MTSRKTVKFNSELLKRRREEMRLTQTDLARMIGKSQQMIALYENGSNIPKADVLEKMCRVLGLNQTDLLYDSTLVYSRYGDLHVWEDKAFATAHAFQTFLWALGYHADEVNKLGEIQWECIDPKGARFTFSDDDFFDLMDDVKRYIAMAYRQAIEEIVERKRQEKETSED